jgi:peptide/nickel transport system ATP-binding protein
MAALRRRLGFSVLFVSHDLPLTLETCGRVAVLYGGRMVECAPSAALRASPGHPYTQGLLACFIDPRRPPTEVHAIPGAPPDPAHLPPGCAFHPRCPAVLDRCRHQRPALVRLGPTHDCACHLHS